MRIERTQRFGLAVALLFVAAGCPGTLEDKDRFLVDAATIDSIAGSGGTAGTSGAGGTTGSCGDVPTRIFQPQCGNTGCHGAVGPQEGLDLVSAGIGVRVVGVAGKECSGTLADPASPQTSLLYTKLSAQPPCGAQMPLVQTPLSGPDMACVLAWIAGQ